MLDEVVIKLTTNIVVAPQIRIKINGDKVFDGLLENATSIRHEIDLKDRLIIKISKTGKTKEVVHRQEPQEVLVEEVLLNGLSQHPDKFGTFSQEGNTYKKDEIIQGTLMALNGSWSLDVPVFRQPFTPELDQTQRDQFADTGTACFGCSFTHGSFLEYDQTWPYYLGSNAKNFGVGGNSISAIVGTAHWYVQNFKCDRLVMLLPHVCRFQLQDEKKGVWTFIPLLGDRVEGEAKETVKDIVMFGEPSLLFSGYSNRMKELLSEINQKTDLYITSYQPDTYELLGKTMKDVCKILPFYEMSDEFEKAPDHEHPGPGHNRVFADKIRPILGG
jgi:hypothetical protein